MKVAVFGKDREVVERVIRRLNRFLKTEAVKPKIGEVHGIVDMAKETYGQNKRNNVVYDGCVLQFLTGDIDENLLDVYEQIVITSLVNIDKVFIVTPGMNEEELKTYEYYSSIMDDKISFITSEEGIVL